MEHKADHLREVEEDILIGNEINNHTNDDHHYLQYIVTVIFYNVHLMTSRAALEAQRRRLRGHIFSFEYFQRSPTRSMARDDILEPDKQTKNKLNH